MPDNDRSRPGERAAPTVFNSDTPILRQTIGNLGHFQHRVVQDALTEAMRTYWIRRAEAFEKARPLPDEFHGAATKDQLQAKWHELTAIAAACRGRAYVSPMAGILPKVEAIFAEVA